MKPILNLSEITDFQSHEQGSFAAKYANISTKIGAEKLGYNITIVPPGKKSWPFHNHHISEEMFIILKGKDLNASGTKNSLSKKMT